MKTKKRCMTVTVLEYCLAFFVPFIFGLLMFAKLEIAPFGEASVLNMDLWGQYFPMYIQQSQIRSVSDFFYSWNGGLGYNNWAQSSYYTNSIFLLLFRFVKLESTVYLLNWICIIKLGLSSVTCMLFLRYKFQKGSLFILGASCSYSMCMYALAFMSQPMWTDALIYVPLVLLAIERIIRNQKAVFYSFILSIVILSNFYIAFSVCIFSAFYFVVRIIQETDVAKDEGQFKLLNNKQICDSVIWFATGSLLAGAVSAVCTVHVLYAISKTIASENSFPTAIEWYQAITEYLRYLLPEQTLKLGYTGVNIFTGIAVFSLLPLYFFNKSIKRKYRITNGGFLVFLILSMNLNILDYMWHGFHFPNQLPGRWTFLFSLMIVILCVDGLLHIDGISLKRTILSALLGMSIVFLTIHATEQSSLSVQYWCILAVENALIVTMVYLNHKSISVGKGIAFLLIAFVCVQIMDSGYNFIKVASLEQGGFHVSSATDYTTGIKKMNDAGIEWKPEENDFYRVEACGGMTFNPSMFGDFKGISYYSSTMQGSVYRLLEYLGNRVYAQNVSSVYSTSSIVQNALLGVKYVIDFNKNTSMPKELVLCEEEEEYNVWENMNCLPIGYMVSENSIALKLNTDVRGFDNQNCLLEALYGEDITVFKKLSTSMFSYTNVELSENQNWNNNYYVTQDLDQKVTFSYQYICPDNGAVYLDNNFRTGTLHIISTQKDLRLRCENSKQLYLGDFQSGDQISIEFEVQGYSVGCAGLDLFIMDADAWNKVYSKLASQVFELESFDGTSMSGMVKAEADGVLMFTIPQDGGWFVDCNGSSVDTYRIGDVLLAIPVKEGDNYVELEYHVPGYKLGMTISILAVAILIFLALKNVKGPLQEDIK